MKHFAKKLVTLSLLLASISLAIAQSDSVRSSRKMKLGFYQGFEYMESDFSNLNPVLVANGFPAVNDLTGGTGFGLTLRRAKKDSYFSVRSFHFTSMHDWGRDQLKSSMLGYSGMALGWHPDLMKSEKWRLGPDITAGFGMISLRLTERPASSNSFGASVGSFFPNSDNQKKYYGIAGFGNAGASIERKVKIGWMDFYFGLGASYRYSSEPKFYEGHQAFTDSPEVTLTGMGYNFRVRIEMREMPKRMMERMRKWRGRFH
jgi:hypothetical protein